VGHKHSKEHRGADFHNPVTVRFNSTNVHFDKVRFLFFNHQNSYKAKSVKNIDK